MRMIPPKNWPEEITYSNEAVSLEVHPLIVRSFLASPKPEDQHAISKLIEENRVHSHLSIERLDQKDHPLASMKTCFGSFQRGLFATEDLPSGTDLGEYVGEIKVLDTKWKKPHISSYYYWVVQMEHLYYVVDAMKWGNELAMVNDFRGIAKEPNVTGKMIVHRGHWYFGYGTIKPVKKGEEILADYGHAYWQEFIKSTKK